MSHQPDSLLDAIPNPPAIRSRLAELMREQDLLRTLLRIAERKQQGEAAPTPRHEEEAAHA